MAKIEPISLEKVKTYPLGERQSKVRAEDFSRPWSEGGSLAAWLDRLPQILAAKDLNEIVDRIVIAVSSERKVILGMGAHPIKVGLSPIIIDLMERGILSAIAMNGACIIHDCEVAMVGHTSEDVASELGEGRFGMAKETAETLNQAIAEGWASGIGLGEAVGKLLIRKDFPYNKMSILAKANELDIPVTVHVAIGTDIIHCHPSFDGAAAGKVSHHDFKVFAGLVKELEGGVFINLGSAVILPEVFLKAVSVVRNLGFNVKEFTTVNMDFIRHYRPMTNVVHRPTQEGGKGYSLVGHHEIMLPLLAAAVIERLA